MVFTEVTVLTRGAWKSACALPHLFLTWQTVYQHRRIWQLGGVETGPMATVLSGCDALPARTRSGVPRQLKYNVHDAAAPAGAYLRTLQCRFSTWPGKTRRFVPQAGLRSPGGTSPGASPPHPPQAMAGADWASASRAWIRHCIALHSWRAPTRRRSEERRVG